MVCSALSTTSCRPEYPHCRVLSRVLRVPLAVKHSASTTSRRPAPPARTHALYRRCCCKLPHTSCRVQPGTCAIFRYVVHLPARGEAKPKPSLCSTAWRRSELLCARGHRVCRCTVRDARGTAAPRACLCLCICRRTPGTLCDCCCEHRNPKARTASDRQQVAVDYVDHVLARQRLGVRRARLAHLRGTPAVCWPEGSPPCYPLRRCRCEAGAS